MSFRTLAAALILAAGACAAELPQLRVEPVAAASNFYIKNISSQPLTAYLVELDGYPGSAFGVIEDAATSEPLAPGTEKKLHVSDMTAGAAPEYVKVESALYADGSTGGSPEKVQELLDHRRFMLETTRELTSRLQKAKAAGTSNIVTAQELKEWANTMKPSTNHSARYSSKGLNNADARKLILDTATKVESSSVESALSGLHSDEQSLAASKPTL
jgi:hypothetical protein